jgi:single-strand DNA-binding protein
MAEDINKVMLVGRLTRDAELQYTNSGYALCKFSVAVNRRKKEGNQWIDEANYFDGNLWGKRGESLNSYLTKGTQVAIEGQLKQDRWEKDGVKRSKVSIEVSNIQLLGGKSQGQPQNGHNQNGSMAKPQQSQSFESYTPPTGPSKDEYEDDIPF